MSDNIATIVSADNDINVVLDAHFRTSQTFSGAEILEYSLVNGILPLPIRSGTKRPLISGWSGADQHVRINGETVVLSGKTASEIFDVWRNGGKDRFLNAPIGWRTGNTYVVNKDDPYATEQPNTILIGVDIDSDVWVQPFLDEFQPNVVVRGAKGIKIPIFIKNAPHISGKIQYKDTDGNLAFELLRTNQTQMVMCGQHPKGVPYLWYYNEFPLDRSLECYEWDKFNEKIERIATRMGLTKTSGVDEPLDTAVDVSPGQLVGFESAWDIGTSWSYRIRQANSHLTDEEFYTKLRMWPHADIRELTILPDGSVQGSHPVHGSEASGTNYQLNPITGMWRCWKHESWGDLIDFVGMDMGFISCEELSTITAEERKINPDKYAQQRQLRYERLHGFYKIILKGIQHLGVNVPADLVTKARDETRDVATDDDGRIRVIDLSRVRDSDYLTEQDVKNAEIGSVVIKGNKTIDEADRERYARAVITHLYVNENLDEQKIIEKFGTFNSKRLKDHYTPEQAIEYVRFVVGGLIEQKRHAALSLPESNDTVEIVPGEPEITQDILDEALTILSSGDPIRYMLDTWGTLHIGDPILGEACILSVVSQSVHNSRGIHLLSNGKSGKGKTDAFEQFVKLIPHDYKIVGSMSDKALYYTQINPQTVLYIDDKGLSESMQDVVKSCMSDFTVPQTHYTVTNQESRVLTTPERLVFWFAKVEDVGDEQVMDRLVSIWIDDSDAQDRRVHAIMSDDATRIPTSLKTPREILICRAMWHLLKQNLTYVVIPYATDIILNDYGNRRNFRLIHDIIRSYALMRVYQRKEQARTDDGIKVINADYDDFNRAQKFFNAITTDWGSQTTKLTKDEKALTESLVKLGMTQFTYRDIMKILGCAQSTASRLMQGRKERSEIMNDGLLRKCPAISSVDETNSVRFDEKISKSRKQQMFLFDINAYRAWINTSEGGDFFWFDPDSRSGSEYVGYLRGLYPTYPSVSRTYPRSLGYNKNDADDVDSQNSTIIYNNNNNNNIVSQGNGERETSCVSHTPTPCDDHTHPTHTPKVWDTGIHILENDVTASKSAKPTDSPHSGISQDSGYTGIHRDKVGYTGMGWAQLIVDINPDDFVDSTSTHHACHQCGRRAKYESTDKSIHLCQECMTASIGRKNTSMGVGS